MTLDGGITIESQQNNVVLKASEVHIDADKVKWKAALFDNNAKSFRMENLEVI